MSRFQPGDKVWKGRGEFAKQITVAKVHDNPMLPVFQYSFEAPNDGFLCGEQSLRWNEDDPDFRLRDCWKEQYEDQVSKEVSTRINTITSGMMQTIDMDDFGLSMSFEDSDIFFKPNLEMVDWLVEYANDRLIVDVGSGQGHLVNMISRKTKKVMGIEPNFNHEWYMKWRMTYNNLDLSPNRFLQGTIQRWSKMLNGLGADKILLVFARPCHSTFVREGIRLMNEGTECLYITLPENIRDYNDLGSFKFRAKLLEHKGISEDNEVVYSVIR